MPLMVNRLDRKRLEWAVAKAENAPMGDRMLAGMANVFEITNVADLVVRMAEEAGSKYFDTGMPEAVGQPDMEIKWDKFPMVGPPYEEYWMEWRLPKKWRLSGMETVERVGALVQADELVTDEESFWILTLMVFTQRKGHHALPIAVMTVDVGYDGTVYGHENVDFADGAFAEVFPQLVRERRKLADWLASDEEKVEQLEQRMRARGERSERALVEQAVEGIHPLVDEMRMIDERVQERTERLEQIWQNWMRGTIWIPIMMAHSLLACKNIEQEVHATQPTKRERKAGVRGVQFKTLKIAVSAQAKYVRREGEDDHVVEGKVSMHLVRGHFKTFTAEKPLYGKHVGTYWWSPQVRGNKDVGVVVKDYEVK